VANVNGNRKKKVNRKQWPVDVGIEERIRKTLTNGKWEKKKGKRKQWPVEMGIEEKG
jgi:hypothetical protein